MEWWNDGGMGYWVMEVGVFVSLILHGYMDAWMHAWMHDRMTAWWFHQSSVFSLPPSISHQ
jgi:sterol desaturase/sphingolipid hydroxylase (fatty acid hydroxylase superfamily)